MNAWSHFARQARTNSALTNYAHAGPTPATRLRHSRPPRWSLAVRKLLPVPRSLCSADFLRLRHRLRLRAQLHVAGRHAQLVRRLVVCPLHSSASKAYCHGRSGIRRCSNIYAPCPSPITIEIWGSILDYLFINHTLRSGTLARRTPFRRPRQQAALLRRGILCIASLRVIKAAVTCTILSLLSPGRLYYYHFLASRR